jgi:glycosyltransferase involved in cell wall biosynthesis
MKIAILTTDNREPYREYHKPNPWFGTAPKALLQGFAQLPEIEVHLISCTQRHMFSSPEKLRRTSISTARMSQRSVGCAHFIRAASARREKKIREIQPDIVHGQGTERECALGAIFSGFPSVVTIHGNMRAVAAFYRARMGGYYWLAARLEAFALRRTDGVFCNSAYTESLVKPVAAKTWRVPNAVRRIFFDQPISRAQKDAPVLLNVGMMSPYKRQRDILALAGNLWRQGLKFELRFAGNRQNNTKLGRSFARELAAAEKAGFARHIGWLSEDQLISAMDAASALIHAPTEEAFGLVVAEALSRGLKFFGSRCGGIADIADGVDGAELFGVDDWDGMADAVGTWLKNGNPLAPAAAVQMRERYHPQVIARRHLEIYREVLAANNKS